MMNILSFLKPLPDSEHKVPEDKIPAFYRFWRIRMFWSMYLGYVFFYFTRKNESFVRSVMGQELGLTVIELGTLSTIIYITYGIGKFLNGLYADRANIKSFMALGLLGSSIINIFYPYLPSFALLAFFWGLNGFFQSMGFPPIAKGLVYWFSIRERASKWTLWSSSHTAGAFLIGVIVSYILRYADWKAAFYIPGIVGVFVSAGLWYSLTDKPSSVGLPPIDEYAKDPIPVKCESGLSHKEILKRYVFTNKFLWMLAFAYIFVYFVRFATLDWGTKFLCDQRGFSPPVAALWMSFMPLAGIFGGILAGFIADYCFKGRCTQINIIYLFLLGIASWGFYEYAYPDKPFITILCLSAIGFLVDGPQNMIGGVQASRVTVQQAASAATGFTGFFGYMGAAASGIGASLLINSYGWKGFYYFCVISCVISILFLLASAKGEVSNLPSDNNNQV